MNLGFTSSRRSLIRLLAALATFLWAVLLLSTGFSQQEPDIAKLLELHAYDTQLHRDTLGVLALVQLALSLLSYLLVYIENRLAIWTLSASLGIALVTYLFGGLSVTFGLAASVAYLLSVVEGGIFALLLLGQTPHEAKH